MSETTPDYRPDFFDRALGEGGGSELRCRPCGFVVDHIPRDWLDARTGDVLPCPSCKLGSRIPVAEEECWPERKDPTDPMAGVSPTSDLRDPNDRSVRV